MQRYVHSDTVIQHAILASNANSLQAGNAHPRRSTPCPTVRCNFLLFLTAIPAESAACTWATPVILLILNQHG